MLDYRVVVMASHPMDTFAVPTDGGDLMTKQSIGLNYLR